MAAPGADVAREF